MIKELFDLVFNVFGDFIRVCIKNVLANLIKNQAEKAKIPPGERSWGRGVPLSAGGGAHPKASLLPLPLPLPQELLPTL